MRLEYSLTDFSRVPRLRFFSSCVLFQTDSASKAERERLDGEVHRIGFLQIQFLHALEKFSLLALSNN